MPVGRKLKTVARHCGPVSVSVQFDANDTANRRFGAEDFEGGFYFPAAHASAKMTIVIDTFRVWILVFFKGKHYGFYA
jgi:hypothetical protein